MAVRIADRCLVAWSDRSSETNWSRNAVHAQFDRLLDAISEKLPTAAEHLDTARADILALTACPKAVWRLIWSNSHSVERPATCHASASGRICRGAGRHG